jgi:signal peptidase I
MTRNQKPDAPALPLGAAKGALRDNLEIILFAVVLITFFKTFVGQQFGIPSASMRNTLMIGDHLLANKFIFAVPQWNWEARLFPMRKVERGDIIVFRYPMDREMDYVKRCVAIPGDRVEVRGKRLYVNGKLITGTFEHHCQTEMGQPEPGPWPLERNAGPTQYQQALDAAQERNALPASSPSWAYDPALYPESVNVDRQGMLQLGNDPRQPFYFRDDLAPFTVPEGNIMAMGDNRDRSADSRYWGLLPMDHLRGRPFIIWWSYQEGGNDDTRANTSENPGDVLSNAADVLVYGFSRTRWKRTGTIPK